MTATLKRSDGSFTEDEEQRALLLRSDYREGDLDLTLVDMRGPAMFIEVEEEVILAETEEDSPHG